MSQISKSAIGEDFPEAFRVGLDACTTPEEVKAYMRAAYVQLGAGVPDEIDPNIIHLAEPAGTEPRPFVATVTVDGKSYQFTGASAAEAQEAMIAFTTGRVQQQQQQEPEKKPLELVYDPLAKAYRDSSGRFVSDQVAQNIIQRHEQEASQSYQDAALDAELRLKMARGEISLTDAFAQIEPKVQARREQRSWAAATEQFLASDRGSDWIGDDGSGKNLERIGNKLAELGLADKPSVESLAAAWESMKQEDAEAAQATIDEQYQKELAACTSRTEIDAVTAKYFQGRTLHSMGPDELRERGFWDR